MKKYHIILIVLLGMFLMPSTAMACGNSNSKHSCEKEVSSKKTEKNVVVVMTVLKAKMKMDVKVIVVMQIVVVL